MKTATIKKYKLLTISTIVFLFSFSALSHAQSINHFIKSVNIEAEADYVVGDIEKPAVVIIHGFLTTNRFHTVEAMAKALQDEGFSTLTPTLTLDISMTQALAGDDVKTHNIIKTTAEMILNSGYDLVFEGIEDNEMLERAKKVGATHIQGYLIGKPAASPKIF